ncbi:MAG: hypothetical protein ACREUR_06780 [Nitrosospira sp.]
MRKIVGRTLPDMLLFLNNYGHTLISLIGSARRAERRAGASENEGLGATYDKRKWMEAYYDTPETAALERINRDTFHT